jgi:hypothetical protein
VTITDIRSTVVAGNFAWILVRAYTDEGLVGLGEAYWGPGVRAILVDPRFKSILISEDPTNVDRCWLTLKKRLPPRFTARYRGYTLWGQACLPIEGRKVAFPMCVPQDRNVGAKMGLLEKAFKCVYAAHLEGHIPNPEWTILYGIFYGEWQTCYGHRPDSSPPFKIFRRWMNEVREQLQLNPLTDSLPPPYNGAATTDTSCPYDPNLG